MRVFGLNAERSKVKFDHISVCRSRDPDVMCFVHQVASGLRIPPTGRKSLSKLNSGDLALNWSWRKHMLGLWSSLEWQQKWENNIAAWMFHWVSEMTIFLFCSSSKCSINFIILRPGGLFVCSYMWFLCLFTCRQDSGVHCWKKCEVYCFCVSFQMDDVGASFHARTSKIWDIRVEQNNCGKSSSLHVDFALS